MALTVTKDAPRSYRVGKNSPYAVLTGKIAFDSSYPTGGESTTGITNSFRTALQITFISDDGYTFKWDKTNNKVLAYTQGITTGATGAADSTSGALVLNTAAAESVFRAMGTAVSTTYNLQGLKEVPDTTDLSATDDVRFVAYGLL